jgi:hypothetical protein
LPQAKSHTDVEVKSAAIKLTALKTKHETELKAETSSHHSKMADEKATLQETIAAARTNNKENLARITKEGNEALASKQTAHKSQMETLNASLATKRSKASMNHSFV